MIENEIRYAYTSHLGKRRSRHEDNFWCGGAFLPPENAGTGKAVSGSASWDACPAFAVFDGMGGESRGDMAAYLSAREFGAYREAHFEEFRKHPGVYIDEVCKSMNHAVTAYAGEHRIDTMGTTAVMTFFHHDGILGANLGDSRLYQLSENGLRQLSTDHVAGRGAFAKAPLTQYLGIDEPGTALDPASVVIKASPGDILLMCTDGLTDLVRDEEIAEILGRVSLAGEGNLPETALLLQEKALERGGRDNVTVLLLAIPSRKRPFFARWRKAR